MAVFIGREREIALLERKLDEALAGSGGVAVLAGEPGIGKTATTRHFGAYAVAWFKDSEGNIIELSQTLKE